MQREMEQAQHETGRGERRAGTASPSAFSPPPRPLTPAARRRSWAEPPVRSWLIAAGLFVIAAGGLGVGQWHDWSENVWLLRHGQRVEATILTVGGVGRGGFQMPPPAEVEVQFPWEGGMRKVAGRIEPEDGYHFVSPHRQIRIRVDPGRPERWSARQQAPSLPRQFLGSGILLGMALLSGLAAWWRRNRALRAWRNGEAIEGVVVSAGRSAMAPRSWCIRWMRRGSADKRLFVAYIPQRLGDLRKGEVVQLLGDPRRPRGAVMARVYQERSGRLTVGGCQKEKQRQPPAASGQPIP